MIIDKKKLRIGLYIFGQNLQIVGALKKAGYRQINLEGYGLLPPPLFNQLPAAARLNNWLGKLPILKLFAYRFIIYAKK